MVGYELAFLGDPGFAFVEVFCPDFGPGCRSSGWGR